LKFHPLVFPTQESALLRPDPDQVGDGQAEYEVKEILNKRTNGTVMEYLVCWEGYRPEDDTWEPRSGLTKVRRAVQEYEAQG
jgi:hypothetical protein